MDFFARQDEARQRTRVLVFYFAAAVALIIATVYLVLAALLKHGNYPVPWSGGILYPPLLLGVTAVVGAIIAAGTLYKVAELSRPHSGERLAQLMGGRQISPGTADPDERRLLNVVEEMAIAAGLPVPPVYLLEEESINAFAAGLAPASAVVAVTQGAVRRLSRDELQGVVGHEFSHILNGDMRLNVRLLGVLYGILVVALTGTYLLRAMGRPRMGSKKGGGGILVLLAIGLTLMVVGYAGQLMAQLIQRAVSRQREFLADAASVQFTRNPRGIAGALAKIGQAESGARLASERAGEMGHFLFADGLRRSFLGLLSTHPPLSERIRRIDPSFATAPTADKGPPEEAPRPTAAPALAAVSESFPLAAGRVLAGAGAPTPQHLDYAAALVQSLPADLAAAAREPFSARALVCLLLLDPREEVRAAQLERLEQGADPQVFAEIMRLAAARRELRPEHRLPLVSLCMPALWQLSPGQRRAFLDQADSLILSDQRVSLFEFCVRRLVRRPGQAVAGRPGRKTGPAIGRLLSALAHAGSPDQPEPAALAFARGLERLPGFGSLTLVPAGDLGPEALDAALDVLAASPPRLRQQLLDACLASAGADGRIGLAEAELVRAIADSLSCPLPPLAPGAVGA